MLKKYFYKIITVLFIFTGIISYSHVAFAATIDVVPSLSAGVYDVVLSVNNKESINAVSGTVIFNENISVIPTIETNNSIVSLWVDKPSVSGNSINFSGIIPGGFSLLYDQFGDNPQQTSKLFSIVFPFVKNINSYTFTVDSSSAYLNDGHGTEIIIPSKSITLPASSNINDFAVVNSNNNINLSIPSTSTKSITFSNIYIIIVLLILVCFLVERKYHFLRNFFKK